jgi:hypothetical protein
MDAAQIAARLLLQKLALPAWAVSIWPWREDDNRIVLRVMIDPSYRARLPAIPDSFNGFPVIAEWKTPNQALNSPRAISVDCYQLLSGDLG